MKRTRGSFLFKKLKVLKKSKKKKVQFIKELGYGKIPTSVLEKEQIQNDVVLNRMDRTYASNHALKRNAKYFIGKIKETHPDTPHKYSEMLVRRNFSQKAKNCRLKDSCLSIFPQKIGRLLVRFYSKKGDTVVDFFAGHNSRMQLVHECQRNYVGFDVSSTFMEHNKEIRERLLKREKQGFFDNKSEITLFHQDSSKVDLPNEYADFSITSPPYYDLEWYGDEEKQLGKAKTYKEFLKKLTPHVQENFRVLKRGAYSVWCVNDFVRKGKYHCYHSDLIQIAKNAGFTVHAVYILDMKSALGIAFIDTIMRTMRFPKRHEYILVFKKESE